MKSSYFLLEQKIEDDISGDTIRSVFVNWRNIQYIFPMGNECELHMAGGETILITNSIEEFLKMIAYAENN